MFAWRDNYISYNGAANDPYWTSVSLLENFEYPLTPFIDDSNNNFPITITGTPNPTSKLPSGNTGGSGFFVGNTSTPTYLTMPANSAWSLGTGNFTFECWVYITNFSDGSNFGGYMPIVTWGDGSYKVFRVRPTGINFESSSLFVSYNATWPGAVTIVINTWYNVALVRSSTTSVTAYLNGVPGTPTTINATAQFGDATNVMNVGVKPNDPGYWWGYMSNWRLTKGTALYSTTYTPSTIPLTASASTSGLLTFTNQGLISNNIFVDNSGVTNAPLTFTGSPSYSGLSPFDNTYPGSINFVSASVQYITIPSNIAFTYGTGDFTIECWFYRSSIGVIQYLIDQRNSGVANAIIPTLYIDASNFLVYFVSNAVRIQGASALSAGTWYSVSVSRSSTSTKMFLNGTQDGSTYTDSNSYATSRVSIGNNGATAGNYFNGYITNVRLSKGFAYYTANYTPSTIPLTNSTTYTSLLLLANSGFQDLSTQGQKITSTVAGSSRLSTIQKKFGTQSSLYTPQGYQTVSDATSLQFGTGDFTIECWVYRNAAGVLHSIISKGTSTTGYTLQINTSNQLIFTSTTTILKTSTTTIGATTWTYVAITRSGTTGYMFINGTLEGATYSDTTNYNQTSVMYIGADRSATNGLNGYLDDIRITKGVCRYTASFTAPTSSFPTS